MYLEHRLSALLRLHHNYRLNSWLHWIGQRQLQDETRNISRLGFGEAYIRVLMAFIFIDSHKNIQQRFLTTYFDHVRWKHPQWTANITTRIKWLALIIIVRRYKRIGIHNIAWLTHIPKVLMMPQQHCTLITNFILICSKTHIRINLHEHIQLNVLSTRRKETFCSQSFSPCSNRLWCWRKIIFLLFIVGMSKLSYLLYPRMVRKELTRDVCT